MSYSEIKQNCKGYYSDFEVKIQDGGMVFRKKKRVFFDKGLSEKGRLRQLIGGQINRPAIAVM